MDGITPNTPVTAENLLQLHAQLYRAAAAQQHEQVAGALACTPPDYSHVATSAHRALQFVRQAEALETVQRELLAMRLTGEAPGVTEQAQLEHQLIAADQRPHSRACGWRAHPHGSACHANCPTCGGRE